ncbi:MAG: P-loop NTPase fold protein [Hyphomicrobiales bacterium]
MDNYLTVPEMEIELYGKGFEGVCQLGRAKDGEKLSELVEKLSTPTVIALDAPWGAGKTVFLKCWSGAHKSENNGTAEIIYFDAFKDDFLDDPLIGLISAISERLKDNKDKEKIWEKAKVAALKVMPSLTRIALAAATSGVSEVVGPTLADATKATAEEIEKLSDQFWEKEDDRKAAMTSFQAHWKN